MLCFPKFQNINHFSRTVRDNICHVVEAHAEVPTKKDVGYQIFRISKPSSRFVLIPFKFLRNGHLREAVICVGGMRWGNVEWKVISTGGARGDLANRLYIWGIFEIRVISNMAILGTVISYLNVLAIPMLVHTSML